MTRGSCLLAPRERLLGLGLESKYLDFCAGSAVLAVSDCEGSRRRLVGDALPRTVIWRGARCQTSQSKKRGQPLQLRLRLRLRLIGAEADTYLVVDLGDRRALGFRFGRLGCLGWGLLR